MAAARTEVGVDGVHVGVVALAGGGVAGAVAVGEQRGGVVGDEREEQHDGGAGHPAELRDGPRQRQHPGPDHRRDDVRARRPHRPCTYITAQTGHATISFNSGGRSVERAS